MLEWFLWVSLNDKKQPNCMVTYVKIKQVSVLELRTSFLDGAPPESVI
jgi:hypothetical protein